MAPTVRFGVSMEPALLARFDRLLDRSGYSCRSEALRDLVRRRLDEDRQREEDSDVVGTVTIVYDHEQHDLAHRLTHIQHDHHATVVANVHVHLDPQNCLEVLIVRGRSSRVRRLADELIATKGVRHGRLNLTAARD
ncbi:MAG: nickel-responsive transcriptional regulator NikR [bacterium]